MSEPTILVPGFQDDAGRLRGLSHWLAQANLHPHPFAPHPSNGTVAIEALAHQLAHYIAITFPSGQPINLFGFSMGGLICRSYIQQLGGAAHTRRLITLATPHNGTYTAYMFNRPACVQMRPGSAFLRHLNQDLSALAQLNFTSIWTPLDLMIVPAISSVLPVGENISIVSPLHRTLPGDSRILRAIAERLRRPYLPQNTNGQELPATSAEAVTPARLSCYESI